MDKSLLSSVKDSIVQGFQWGTREGPLCDERTYISDSVMVLISLVHQVMAYIVHIHQVIQSFSLTVITYNVASTLTFQFKMIHCYVIRSKCVV